MTGSTDTTQTPTEATVRPSDRVGDELPDVDLTELSAAGSEEDAGTHDETGIESRHVLKPPQWVARTPPEQAT